LTEKTPSFRHRLEYLAVVSVVAGVRLLPMTLVLALGSMVGRAFYLVDGAHRRRAVRNIQAAFPLRGPKECQAIARGMFSHFGRLLTVLPSSAR
jgi:lauroyl/myristoyl acyltransferase